MAQDVESLWVHKCLQKYSMDRLGPLLASKAPVFEATVCQMLRVQAQLVQCRVQSVNLLFGIASVIDGSTNTHGGSFSASCGPCPF